LSCEEVTMTVAHYHPSCVCETTFKWKHGGGDRIIVCTVSRFPCVSLYSPGTQRLLYFSSLYAAIRYEQAPKRVRSRLLVSWIGYTWIIGWIRFALTTQRFTWHVIGWSWRDRSVFINHGACSGRCRTEQCSCQSSLTPTPWISESERTVDAGKSLAHERIRSTCATFQRPISLGHLSHILTYIFRCLF